MTQYLYPQNLTAKANFWLWGMRDFIILCVALLISLIIWVSIDWILPMAITMCFAFLTIRHEEMTMLDFIKYAVRYFITSQQYYEWGDRK